MRKSILAIFLGLVILLSGLVNAAPVPATVDMVIINGMPVSANANNRLSLERDSSFSILMSVTAQADVKNVHARAEVFGYEYGDYTLIGTASNNADWETNTTYPMLFNIALPSDVESDNYKLRITLTNRDNEEVVLNYNIKVDSKRHSMKINDVLMYPGESVQSGSALLTSVRVENLGQNTEKNVKVKVSVPDLGISASTYLDRVSADDEEGTEELYLRVPTCAAEGNYDLKVEVSYDRAHSKVSETRQLSVVADDSCNLPSPSVASETNTAPLAPVITVVNQAPASVSKLSTLRNGLEVALLVLVGLLVVIGLVIGFTKLKATEDDDEE